MLGEVTCPNLTAFFELFILNKEQLSNGTTLSSYAAGILTGIARKTNTLANSQLNISAHYDISNDMFAAFLSEDMTYSCPVWRLTSDPKSATETLQDAQMTKIQRFIDQARIQPTDHVLEIGTGWGSLAIEAVRQTGCRITSITLSKEQKELAEERIKAAGFQDKIEVQLMDYRALAPDTLFDKIVSCEMLEAVGKEYLMLYFDCVNRVLKPEGGIAVFQCITIPDEAGSPSVSPRRNCKPNSLAALRRLRQDRRLHPPLHLPRRPPALRVQARRLDPRRLPRPARRRARREHRPALRQDAAPVARKVHAELCDADRARAAGRARRHVCLGHGGLPAEVGVLLYVLRGRLPHLDAGRCHHHGGPGGDAGLCGGRAVVGRAEGAEQAWIVSGFSGGVLLFVHIGRMPALAVRVWKWKSGCASSEDWTRIQTR